MKKSFLTSGPVLVANQARQVLHILYLFSPSPTSQKSILKCRLSKSSAASHTYFSIQANSMDPDQTAHGGEVCSQSTLFATETLKNSRRHTAGDI